MSEHCINAEEAAGLLKVAPRTLLNKRHEWTPRFPQPIHRKPLVWRLADVEDWIVRASRERNAA